MDKQSNCSHCQDSGLSPDTGSHLRISTTKNVMYCLRCGYAGRWDGEVASLDELVQQKVSGAPSVSEVVYELKAEDIFEQAAESMPEPRGADDSVAVPLEKSSKRSPIVVEEFRPASKETLPASKENIGEDSNSENRAESRIINVERFAAVDSGGDRKVDRDSAKEENISIVKDRKSSQVEIEEFPSGKTDNLPSVETVEIKDTIVVEAAEAAKKAEKIKKAEEAAEAAKKAEKIKKAEESAEAAKKAEKIKKAEEAAEAAKKAEKIKKAEESAEAAKKAEKIKKAEEAAEAAKKAEKIKKAEEAAEAAKKAEKSETVILNIAESSASERRRHNSDAARRPHGFQPDKGSEKSPLNINHSRSDNDLPDSKTPYYAEHRLPRIHGLDLAEMPEMESEETLDSSESVGFPEDFVYNKKCEQVDTNSTNDEQGKVAKVESDLVKEKAKVSVPEHPTAIPFPKPAKPSVKRRDSLPIEKSVPKYNGHISSWMAPPVNKAAPSSRMNQGNSSSRPTPIRRTAYVPPSLPSRLDSRTHQDQDPSSTSGMAETVKGADGRSNSFVAYLLIFSILVGAGFALKPYVEDMIFSDKAADPAYIPFTSEKRVLALTAAKDKPSEKDAKALVELVQEAELRSAALRAPEDYLVLSTDAWRNKDYHRALEDVFQGLSLDHDNKKVQATLTLRLGTIYAGMNKTEMAIEQYNKASDLDPDFSWPHYYMGNLYSGIGKFSLAEGAYKKSIILDSGYVYTHNNLGNLYSKMGEHANAVNAYNDAIKLDPDYANGHYNQGIIYGKMGSHDKAEKAYKEALRSDPKHAYALNNLGILYEKLDRTDEAEKSFKEALKIDPDHSNAKYNLKKFYENQKAKSDTK